MIWKSGIQLLKLLRNFVTVVNASVYKNVVQQSETFSHISAQIGRRDEQQRDLQTAKPSSSSEETQSGQPETSTTGGEGTLLSGLSSVCFKLLFCC